jgi:cytochrome c-type biogenesis protein CcmH
MTARAGAARVLLALLALVAGPVAAATPDEATVQAIAAQLRCVVCQNLSVADSPSETANQMRAIIRQRLADGETPEQVVAYFVDKYGLWILLAPPRQGFNLLVWIAPFAGLAVGLAVVGAVILRAVRRRAQLAPPSPPVVDEATRGRIAREMAELDR